jgi:hypothetical protein
MVLLQKILFVIFVKFWAFLKKIAGFEIQERFYNKKTSIMQELVTEFENNHGVFDHKCYTLPFKIFTGLTKSPKVEAKEFFNEGV